MYLHLLKNKSLGRLLSISEISECIVSISGDPTTHNRVPILEYSNIFTQLFQCSVQEFHQLLCGEVLWDVANIKLSLRLVMVGKTRLTLLWSIGAQYLSCGSLSLIMHRWLVCKSA